MAAPLPAWIEDACRGAPLLDHHCPISTRTLTARRDAFLSAALTQLDS
jgi:hypothetical protein